VAFFIGGYVTAKITKEDKPYDGLVVGVVVLCMFVAFFLAVGVDDETYEYIPVFGKVLIQIYLLFLVCCSLLGARIKKKRLKHEGIRRQGPGIKP
jgi:uncharacterized membrane protein YcfT